LCGRARFATDIRLAGELHCVLVRSTHAHAAVRTIDAADAQLLPGVVAVLTGADMAADCVGAMRALWSVRSRDGKPMLEPPRYALARGRVRHVGEPIAAVLAESHLQALDAAEHVVVDYEPLPAVVDARSAAAPGAPRLHEEVPDNICFRWARGDAAAVDAAFERAAHVTRIELINNRLIGAAIEPRAVSAEADPVTGRLTVYSATQVPHHIRSSA
jgi:carbon-monoxide dehydrogenase large subunit